MHQILRQHQAHYQKHYIIQPHPIAGWKSQHLWLSWQYHWLPAAEMPLQIG